jgi:hypothetical protein
MRSRLALSSSGVALGLGLAFSSLGIACGDSSASGGAGGTGGAGAGESGPERICIDSEQLFVVPPAGLQLRFRVLDDNGEAVRELRESDVIIINDEKDAPFEEGNEGESVSSLGPASDLELYSILVLDMSDSIVNEGNQDKVIEGARAYVEQVLENSTSAYPHNVALVVFGRPESIGLLQDFTTSTDELYGALLSLEGSESLGTTDLYQAYMTSLSYLDEQAFETSGVTERLLVLISDGAHEAGGTATLRKQALDMKNASGATKLTIGIRGNYDACALEELAGAPAGKCINSLKGCREGITCTTEVAPPVSCTQFQADVDPDELEAAFRNFAARAEGIARSNYAVGVCTPVALGSSSVTVRVDVDGTKASTTLPYGTEFLDGNLSQCDAEDVKGATPPPLGGAGGMSEGGGGAGGMPMGGAGGMPAGGGGTGGV